MEQVPLSNNEAIPELIQIERPRRPEPRHDGFVRLGNIMQVMGKEDGQAVLDQLTASEEGNNNALRRLGLPRRRG